MPCDYKQYHPKWSLISRLIRFGRAKNQCERCRIRNYLVRRFWSNGDMEISHYDGPPNYKAAVAHCKFENGKNDVYGKWSVVVLTVAHLDHDKTNNRFQNLAALCQKCHLSHDAKQHSANRKYGRKYSGKQQLKLLL